MTYNKIGVLVLICSLAGCSTTRITDPPRTATEQFLISDAVAMSIDPLRVGLLHNCPVYVDTSYLDRIDETYIVGAFRAHLLANNVQLVPDAEKAEIIVEMRSGGVGIDRSDFMIGLPGIPLRTFNTEIAGEPVYFTPELPVFKFTRQRGYSSIAYASYFADSREPYAASGPFVGISHKSDLWLLGIGPFSRGDVPTIRKDANVIPPEPRRLPSGADY